NGATNPDYSLTIHAPVPPPPDTYEPNDDSAHATNLGTVGGQLVIPNLSVNTGTDLDWFKFTLGAPATAGHYSVSIDFPAYFGQLFLQLFDANGNRIGLSVGAGNHEEISLTGLRAGTYYANVFGYTPVAGYGGDTNPYYQLTITAPLAPSPDPFEANGGNN